MSKAFAVEVDELIRARYTILYVVTWEEDRARRLIAQVANRQGKFLFEWSVTDGLRKVTGQREGYVEAPQRKRDAMAALNDILQSDVQGIYVLKDFHRYLDAPEVVRQLRDLATSLRRTHKSIIILSPKLDIPQELDKSVTIVDLPLPTYAELGELLDRTIGPAGSRRFAVRLAPEDRDAMLKAAQGLTLAEAENAFARAIVRDASLDASDVDAVVREKIQIIRKSGLLEYYEVDGTLDRVGGMDILKDWLRKRVRAFGEDARAYGLPQPRGILLLGVQGCGKSLVAKTISASWRLPLLRMDMSRIFQGYIGSSEENMRRALAVARSLSPVILWIDEIEKAFAGMGSSGASDGGTTSRVIGHFLTWMQEKEEPVFVVATANEISGLPPELLRKGRLDEVFFVDLPQARERAEIFSIHLRRLRRDPANFEMKALVQASEGFSGAEIEQAIISAMHDSFVDHRELETRDMIAAMEETVPLSRTMRENIATLRAWAADRARPVSTLQVDADNA